MALTATAWVALASVATIGSAAFLYFLPEDTDPMSLGGDGLCRTLTMDSEYLPPREPDHVETVPLADGETLLMERPQGVWRARLVADGGAFALAPPPVPGASPDARWTEVQNMGWCFERASPQPLLARGDGMLTVSYWKGEDDGFHVA